MPPGEIHVLFDQRAQTTGRYSAVHDGGHDQLPENSAGVPSDGAYQRIEASARDIAAPAASFIALARAVVT